MPVGRWVRKVWKRSPVGSGAISAPALILPSYAKCCKFDAQELLTNMSVGKCNEVR